MPKCESCNKDTSNTRYCDFCVKKYNLINSEVFKENVSEKFNTKKTPFYIKLIGGFIGIVLGVTITELIGINSYILVYALMAGGYYGADNWFKNK